MAGEEVTQMLQWFSDFGCERLWKWVQLCSGGGLTYYWNRLDIDYGGKDVTPSKKFIAADVKVQTWSDFVKTSDWSKVFAGATQ
jgi:hypothetical protein